ncbi:MAG: DUF309 domain-containing protein [Ignavibacteria bacterium]|nr:DUF309 domain-containing protein [Ignavibacteria bacterium]
MKAPRPGKKKPEEIRRAPLKGIEMSPEDWEEFGRGVSLFNSGKFWHSHEAWEQVWSRHDEDERLFLQGLIQLAAAYHHLIAKRSYTGVMNNFDKAYAKLEVFQPEYLGIHVKPLLMFIEQGKKEAERLGVKGLEKFNYNLIPKLQFRKPSNPDLLVELREIIGDDQFQEGVKLFNSGYHWEAHEVWEDVWRAQEGDSKIFVQGFVQMAAGYSFVNLHRPDSARYLFEKAVEKFQEFDHLECSIPINELVNSLRATLAGMNNSVGNLNGSAKLLSSPIIPSNINNGRPKVPKR